MIEPLERKYITEIKHITRPIIEALVTECGLEKIVATDVFYNSTTFARLSDLSTKLYLSGWQKIYEMLKQEQPQPPISGVPTGKYLLKSSTTVENS